MPLATSTSTLPQMFVTSPVQCSEDSLDVSPCLDRLYVPHGRYSRFFGQKLRCLGKGVMLRGEYLFDPSFDLLNSPFSRKGHNKLSQKRYSWSSSHCRSDENVDILFYIIGYC
jgi:hypothetical protein